MRRMLQWLVPAILWSADAYKFSSKLALQSRSGIVVIRVCDTPYGTDKTWRGNRGKDVILMEMIRGLLATKGISIDGYHPLTDMPVVLKGIEEPAAQFTLDKKGFRFLCN
jgi:hypothetical protein